MSEMRHYGCCCKEEGRPCCYWCTEHPICDNCGDWLDRSIDNTGKCESACDEEQSDE